MAMNQPLRFLHALAISMAATTICAQPGALDPTFGNNGLVQTQVVDAEHFDNPNAVVVQPDGRIVAVGYTAGMDNMSKGFLMRFLPNGSLDPTFGTGGKVVITPVGGTLQIYHVALQPDGRIVAGGALGVTISTSTQEAWIGRFNTDGTVDAGFGNGGERVFPLSTNTDYVSDVAIGADGSIVGLVHSGPPSNAPACMVRLTPTGQNDNSFSGDGVLCNLFGGSSGNSIGGLAIRSNGTALGAGWAGSSKVCAVSATGSFDGSFGTSGIASIGVDGRWRSIHLHNNGSALVAGWRQSAPLSINFASLLPDGTPDPSFGTNGLHQFSDPGLWSGTWITPAVVYPDGRFMVAWGRSISSPATRDIGVTWFQPNGAVGPVGTVFQDLNDDPAAGQDNVRGMAMAPNGDLIVLASFSTDIKPVVLLRFQGDLGSGTSVHDADADAAVRLFPVPASDRLHVRVRHATDTNMATLHVIGVAGARSEVPVTMHGADATVNVSGLVAGSYLLEWPGADGVSRHRFVVAR